MDVSRRPSGGLRETASAQPLAPASRRTDFLPGLTSVGQKGELGETMMSQRKRRTRQS